MNIIYIGQIVPTEKVKECTGYSAAGDMMQKNLLEGLIQFNNVNIHIISTYPNASWPRDKMVIKGVTEENYKDLKISNVSYLNIPILKQISQKHKIFEMGKKIANSEQIDGILVYNMYPQFGGAALALAKRKNKPLIGILADFPNDENKFWGGNDNLFTKILNAITWKNISRLKYAIVLNKNARKYMAKNNKVTVVPGGIDQSLLGKFEYVSPKNRDIVYAGALTEYSGVLNLIEAVNMIQNKEIGLKIYGAGPLSDEIERRSTNRIKYMGIVSIDVMRKILRESWVLVNPRSTKNFVSSVTFPSKLFEYIACCRPVISTEFDGMEEKIKELVYGCGDGTPEEIKTCIESIDGKDEEEIKNKVKKAYYYIEREFCWKKNAENIYNFLRENLYD